MVCPASFQYSSMTKPPEAGGLIARAAIHSIALDSHRHHHVLERSIVRNGEKG